MTAKPLQLLRIAQASAADPSVNAWASASAGTGKTQVLTARVLRLLLEGAAPESILSLTFTKAAAAEMQTRIFAQLARWATADDAALEADLQAIRAPIGPDARERARQLFARTLDARGGLRVQTLHGFAQSLLASFPIEAGISPGFSALDDRSAQTLRGRVLSEQIDAADAEGDTGFAVDIGDLSIANGEGGLIAICNTLLAHCEAILALGNATGFDTKMRRFFALSSDLSAEQILDAAVAGLGMASLRHFANALARDGGVTSGARADNLHCWLGFDAAARRAQLDLLVSAFFTQKGEPLAKQVPVNLLKAEPSLGPRAESLVAELILLIDVSKRLDAATIAARHLRVGARLVSAYTQHKLRNGVIDYNDMITRAAALLTTSGMGDWVRYKLDQRIDHLLVDEAQDTNLAQWDIIQALTDEFFDGIGASDTRRTLFVVGDFKQAIMSFQGSDSKVFRDRRLHFQEHIQSAQLPFHDVALNESFRSVPAVLAAVDAVIDDLGYSAFGLDEPVPPHVAARKDLPGVVTIWPPLEAPVSVEDETGGYAAEMAWLPDSHLQMAQKVAQQIARWLAPPTALFLPAQGRFAKAGDILVLVRKRGEFMAPLVAALHDAGVNVAGVDRLRLTKPLAAQDLLALVRFVLQPGDDLTLATLLTSPLLDWSQDQLFKHAASRGQRTLWAHLIQSDEPEARAALNWLRDVLALADFSAPYEFLETILSGQLSGRKRLLARLGSDARDAIGALLSQALLFEATNPPTLQGFLAWIEADDSELKRDPEAAYDAVRIMTVHGAKGLQAPIVILADATRDLPRERDRHVVLPIDNGLPVPIFYGGTAGKIGKIADEAEGRSADAVNEHWRLMYVAMTRAQDMLFIGGALPKSKESKPVPPASWYGAIDTALASNFELAVEADAVWGSVRSYRSGNVGVTTAEPLITPDNSTATLPAWALNAAPIETRPARPLSPSALAVDDIAAPPPGPATVAAARRGQYLHSLFEHLPGIELSRRRAVANAWLARNAADISAAARDKLIDSALAIIDAPRFAALFGPEALAEAPITALVGKTVIAGKVDRLWITDNHVQLVDFKTGSSVPADAQSVQLYHLRQMAAYVAALEQIFPGRRISAALLFTQNATWIDLPDSLLQQHHPQ